MTFFFNFLQKNEGKTGVFFVRKIFFYRAALAIHSFISLRSEVYLYHQTTYCYVILK